MALKVAKPKEATPAALGSSSFTRVDVAPSTAGIRRRLVLLVEGESKTGRSHLSLTAPSPIYYQPLDPGGEIASLSRKPWTGKELYAADYSDLGRLGDMASDSERADLAEIIWDRFAANQREAIAKGRTAIIDRESDAWELFRLARTGKANPEKQTYMVLSPEYRGMLRSFYSSQCNLIMIAGLKDEYKKNQSTGNRKRSGFNDADALAQCIVRTWKRNGQYGVTITDCRFNPEIEGIECDNDFATIAQLVYPDSNPEDWK